MTIPLKTSNEHSIRIEEYVGGQRFNLQTTRKMWDEREVTAPIGYFDIRPDAFCCGRGHAGHWCVENNTDPNIIKEWLEQSIAYWKRTHLHGSITATLATSTKDQWSEDINVILANISQPAFLQPLRDLGFNIINCYKSPKTGDGIINMLWTSPETPNYKVNI